MDTEELSGVTGITDTGDSGQGNTCRDWNQGCQLVTWLSNQPLRPALTGHGPVMDVSVVPCKSDRCWEL